MKCLIDSDVLAYECSACGQSLDKETGELEIRDFDLVAQILDQRIREIEGECWADEPSLLFLTGDEKLNGMLNRQRARAGEHHLQFIKNFRHDDATVKAYKGTRRQDKPFHFDNIRVYMLAMYDCEITNGYEADDAIAILLHTDPLGEKYTCCTRDKDLRQVAGRHYGWPCGKQLQFGPKLVTDIGGLSIDGGKLRGDGLAFFYCQMIVGDAVDNIPGLQGKGPVAAFKALNDLQTEEGMFNVVSNMYKDKYADDWRIRFQEQANLLYMIRKLDEQGRPVKYVLFDERDKSWVGQVEI